MASERLQKLISAAGLCSRREAEQWIRQGRVRVNDRIAQVGDQADPLLDCLLIDGRRIQAPPGSLVLLLHKPVGVVCSCADPDGRPTVLDLLPPAMRHGLGLHPVGRLDVASRGALLLTNHGELTLRLTHPRFGHGKTYRVWLRGRPPAEVLERWRRGVPLDGRPSRPVQLLVRQQQADRTLLELTMLEGRNRQIRRTFAALGYTVTDLHRTNFGPYALIDLKSGAWTKTDKHNGG